MRLDLFRARFADVELDTCFSTPAPALQAIGAKHFPDNTFGICSGPLNALIASVTHWHAITATVAQLLR